MSLARWIVAFVALANFGGLWIDALFPPTARQHLRNPRWPPHAKLHLTHGIVMGMGLGTLSLAVLFGAPLTARTILLAAALAGLYFLSLLLAALFPGVAWTDPEFAGTAPRLAGLPLQGVLAAAICLLLLGASALALLGS